MIAGKPNAGKSTLLNALLNEERAIVSDIPGTTRDTVEELLNINGVQFRLIDTAGIRDAQDQIEAIGVERTMEKIKQSSIIIYVFDLSIQSPYTAIEDIKKLTEDHTIPVIAVANKADKAGSVPAMDWHMAANEELSCPVLTISAFNADHIAGLQQMIFDTAVGSDVNYDNPVVANARHFEALTKAESSLQNVLHNLGSGVTSDFVAMDIRQALHYLGEITGEVTTDDLLGNIFGKFCIGK